MRLSDEDLRGRIVIGADGRVIGKADGLLLSSDGWSVEALLVRLRSDVADDLGAARSLFRARTLEVPTRSVQSVGDTVVLSVALPGLRELVPRADQPAEG